MIKIDILPNGNLTMKLMDLPNRESIKRLRKITACEEEAEHTFISEYLGPDNTSNGVAYDITTPEQMGALTDAPLIYDGENVYGYMNYQILNFLDELCEGNEIEWQKG